MKTGLFGGMFDPVHIGHTDAAEAVQNSLGLDRIIFIPANIPAHKSGCVASGKDRLNMLKLATAYNEKFQVSDYELTKEEISYSYKTVEHFGEIFKGDKLYFLIGDEAYALLHTWYHPERIRALAEFVVVTRDMDKAPGDAIYVKKPQLAVSSTKIREKIKNGESTKGILCEAVINYIDEKGIYRGESG